MANIDQLVDNLANRISFTSDKKELIKSVLLTGIMDTIGSKKFCIMIVQTPDDIILSRTHKLDGVGLVLNHQLIDEMLTKSFGKSGWWPLEAGKEIDQLGCLIYALTTPAITENVGKWTLGYLSNFIIEKYIDSQPFSQYIVYVDASAGNSVQTTVLPVNTTEDETAKES